jgi:hypothetical protein
MKRRGFWPLVGFAVGGLIGLTLLSVNVVGASDSSSAPDSVRFGLRDVMHTPPLLVPRGNRVELTYGAVCVTDDPATACEPEGILYVRDTGGTAFAAVPLPRNPDGDYSTTVSDRYARGLGFDYYAVFRDDRGNSITLPEGGAAAPQHAWAVSQWTGIDLGTHVFGKTRSPDRTVVRASWGTGDDQLGLDSGPEQSTIGPSAFDVAADGAVVVLDQVNRRLANYPPGATRSPSHIPIPFQGGEGDLALGEDGTTYVLDEGGTETKTPVVRYFGPDGALFANAALAAPSADMLRAGPNGPVAHTYPGEMWVPTGNGKPPLTPDQQKRAAKASREVKTGLDVVVSASDAEMKLALVSGDRVIRAWRVTSATNLGEVQLAAPQGPGLVAVVRIWTETQAEFRVLRLTPSGLAATFTVDPAEWAETAPLSRFRYSGDTLYQMRSSPRGLEVAGFDVGGTQ